MLEKSLYNRRVPLLGEKKDVPLAMKVPESLRIEIELIANREDRPVGYVARELMIRGLACYKNDGHLRDQAAVPRKIPAGDLTDEYAAALKNGKKRKAG
jgi:hypothetical protein